MSGGHWQYSGYKIRGLLDEIANDPIVQQRWPQLAIFLDELGLVLYNAEHTMDWDISGDGHVEDDIAFQDNVLGEIARLVNAVQHPI